MRFSARILVGIGLLSLVACSAEDGSPSARGTTPAGIGDGEVPGKGSGSHGAEGPSAPGLGVAEPSGSGSDDASGDGSDGDGSSAPEPGSVPIGPAPVVDPESPQGKPGVLTAGVWDDNRNFERFLSFRSTQVDMQRAGLMPISESELQTAHELWLKPPGAREKLDISLIIDTTGSMGDEISYLQAEFLSLSTSIAEQYPNAEQRWSLVAYKDDDDEYVARWFDFRSDAEDFRKNLASLSAGGGGDFPEAPERAFEAATQLAWRAAASTAKLAFWVADAPHHDERAERMADAIRDMLGLGVHVYPVASSGVDDFTELGMRTAAALTGGRYLFLTNDSGVGNDHKEPAIPCYFVTSLRDAIERMVDIELSGTYREPSPTEIIRESGDLQDGACELASGGTVLAY